MLKRLALLLFVLASLGITVVAQNQPQGTPERRITKEPSRSGSEAAAKLDHKDGGRRIDKPAPEQQIRPRAPNPVPCEENENGKVQMQLVNLTAGLVVVGVVQALILALTIGAIRRQTNANRDASRAWIIARVGGQPEEPLNSNLVKGITPGLVWEIQVVGSTPARILSEQYRCRIVSSEDALEGTPAYLPQANPRSGSIALPPGYRYGISSVVEPKDSSVDNVALVTMGKATFCAYGRVVYLDVFGEERVSQFCAIYKPQLGGVFKSPDGTMLNPAGFIMGGPEAYNSYS